MKLPKTSVRIESIRTPVRSHVANTVICRVAARTNLLRRIVAEHLLEES